MTPTETKSEVKKIIDGAIYGDIFVEVRQRVAAYNYYREYNNMPVEFNSDDLDSAYRFLYTTVDPDFIIFCAKKENINALEYLRLIGIKNMMGFIL